MSTTIIVDLTNDENYVSEKKRKIEQIPILKETTKIVKKTSINTIFGVNRCFLNNFRGFF